MPQLPTELLNTIGVALEIIAAGVVASLVALWVSLGMWTLRDIRARTRDFFAWVLATLLVLGVPVLGLVLYFLLRPRETLAAVYDRQLEEEALLRDISARRACPRCQTVSEPDWLVCPRCRTELKSQCVSCSRPLDLGWVICPYCATPVETKTRRTTAPQPQPQQEVVVAPEPVIVPVEEAPADTSSTDEEAPVTSAAANQPVS